MRNKLLILILCLFVINSSAATCTIANGGGNWNSTGTWVEGAVPTAADDVVATATSGQLTIDTAAECKTFVMTGYANTLTGNAGQSLNVAGNVTYSATTTNAFDSTFTIIISGTGTFTHGAKTFSIVTITGGITVTIASGTPTFSTLNLNGLSSASRLIIRPNTSALRTLNATNVSAQYVDFKYIKLSPSVDLSSITGGSGDCGNNDGITFTAATTNYWRSFGVGASVNWGTDTNWFTSSGGAMVGRIPLPQDVAIFDVNSFTNSDHTVVQNMPRIGTMIWSGVANNPTLTTTTVTSFYGDLQLDPNMTLTPSTAAYTYDGVGSNYIQSSGKTWAKAFTIGTVSQGSVTLRDAFSTSSTITVLTGGFIDDGYSVTMGALNSASASSVRYITKTGNWTITSPGNIISLAKLATFTFLDSGMWTLNNNSATLKSFLGAGNTFDTLYINTAGTGKTSITGTNTFRKLIIAPGRDVALTNTMSFGSIEANGTSALPIALWSGAANTINLTGGTLQNVDWLLMTNIVFGTGSTNKAYVGRNSVSNNVVNAVFSPAGYMF